MKVLVKYGAQVDLPVRCDIQKWIQGCGVLFGQTGQLPLVMNIKICSDSLACVKIKCTKMCAHLLRHGTFYAWDSVCVLKTHAG